jgi:hypothetical protein
MNTTISDFLAKVSKGLNTIKSFIAVTLKNMNSHIEKNIELYRVCFAVLITAELLLIGILAPMFVSVPDLSMIAVLCFGLSFPALCFAVYTLLPKAVNNHIRKYNYLYLFLAGVFILGAFSAICISSFIFPLFMLKCSLIIVLALSSLIIAKLIFLAMKFFVQSCIIIIPAVVHNISGNGLISSIKEAMHYISNHIKSNTSSYEACFFMLSLVEILCVFILPPIFFPLHAFDQFMTAILAAEYGTVLFLLITLLPSININFDIKLDGYKHLLSFLLWMFLLAAIPLPFVLCAIFPAIIITYSINMHMPTLVLGIWLGAAHLIKALYAKKLDETVNKAPVKEEESRKLIVEEPVKEAPVKEAPVKEEPVKRRSNSI